MDYRIPDGLAGDEIERQLQEHLHCRFAPPVSDQWVYYDTFDWGVFTDGGLLRHDGKVLQWISREEALGCSQSLETAPGFAADLPDGLVRTRILNPCGGRRLLPVMRIETRAWSASIPNARSEILARLLLERSRYRDPVTGREGPLAGRLRIEPLPGHAAEWKVVAERLENRLGLQRVETPLLVEALAAVGRRPADYSSKLDFRLDPRQRADIVAKHILLTLLDTLAANVEGARKNWDREFLHDLRVATRRTRAALSQIQGVFPVDVADHYKARFAWLQQVTGPVRDLDVYLLAFDGYRESLPAPMRPELEPLHEYLQVHYVQEQQSLAQVLDSSAFTDLEREWRAFLLAPVPPRADAPNAMRPIAALANQRIRHLAKRARREGRAIRDTSPPEDLHELRKTCKKLRYLMEFFANLYPEDRIRPLIKQLKLLLDQLGAFQDLSVQAAHLREMAERMQAESKATAGTLLAMGSLIGDLLLRQRIARGHFVEEFANFDEHDQWRQYKALFWASGAEDEAFFE